jgi:hypothetical protein
LAGCGISRPALISEDQQLAELRGTVKQRGWTLHPGEVFVVRAAEANREDEWPLALDTEALQSEVLEALEVAGIFRHVTREPGAAVNGEHALHLTMKVLEARGKSLGKNENFIPNLFLWWLLSPFAASYVADEDFEGHVKVEFLLNEPGTEEPLWQGVIPVSFEASLDHFQRGITFLDLLPTAPLTASTDAEDVSDVLGPHLYRKLELALIKRLSAELPVPEVDVLVAVSGSSWEPPPGGDKKGSDAKLEGETGRGGEGGKRIAVLDVESFAEAFRGRPGRKEISTLTATSAAALREKLEALSAGTDVKLRDFVLFFSGCGTLVSAGKDKAEAAVALADGGTVKVSELLDLVGKIPAASRCVVLDSGFKGKGGRVSPSPHPPVSPSSTVAPFPADKKLSCLLSACSQSEAGFESAKWRQGALTHFLIPLLSEKADADGDGGVKASEVYEELLWAFSRKLRLQGAGPMTPHLSGDGVLWRYTPKVKIAGKKGLGEKK